jgi:asparagine synthetase B (glutamine-hydrolysing)
VSLDGASAPDPAALAAMDETLAHRGPDSDGSLIDGPVRPGDEAPLWRPSP